MNTERERERVGKYGEGAIVWIKRKKDEYRERVGKYGEAAMNTD